MVDLSIAIFEIQEFVDRCVQDGRITKDNYEKGFVVDLYISKN